MRTALCALLLVSCALPPASRLVRRVIAPRCALHPDGRIRCADADVPLAFPARQLANRAGGGAYVLGPDGLLARIDRHGRTRGVFDSGFSAIVSTNGYLCGSTPAGAVACLRDHHDDLLCAEAELGAPFELTVLRGLALAARPDGALCGSDRGEVVRCVTPRARCDTLCLSYPACSPRRCLDPCAPEQLAASPDEYFHRPAGLR